MIFWLKDGSWEYLRGDREDELRRIIEDHLGREAAMLFDDVVLNYQDRLETECTKQVHSVYLELSSDTDMIISDIEELIKNPDRLKERLQDLKEKMSDELGYFVPEL